MDLHPDFKDLLAAFAAEKVDYLLAGGMRGSPPLRPQLLLEQHRE